MTNSFEVYVLVSTAGQISLPFNRSKLSNYSSIYVLFNLSDLFK
jgi:hypothetical protein